MASYLLPALAAAPRSRPPASAVRAPLGVEDRTASGRGYALTFDDGPHRAGHARRCSRSSPRDGVRATFFLVGEQVRRNPSLARRDRSRRATRSGCTATATATCCAWRRGRCARTSPARRTRSSDASGRAPTLYRPPYGVLNAAALALARARGWRTLLWSHWGRDWEARATPESIAARVTAGAGEGSVLLLHDADDYSAPDSWRRTVAALPRVLETLAERGLEPARPDGRLPPRACPGVTSAGG